MGRLKVHMYANGKQQQHGYVEKLSKAEQKSRCTYVHTYMARRRSGRDCKYVHTLCGVMTTNTETDKASSNASPRSGISVI